MKYPIPLMLLVSASLLSACATYAPTGVQPGQSAGDVERELGPPTGRYGLPHGGTRLEYARGPWGRHTYMIDLDAGGRVSAVQQVLTEANFGTVLPGATRDEVLVKLGRPSERRGAYGDVELWQYRYQAIFCQWFVVTMQRDGRVRDAGYVPDPACDDDDRFGLLRLRARSH